MKKLVVATLGLCLGLSFPPGIRAEDKSSPNLDTIKKLAGEWVAMDKDGKPTGPIVSRIAVTSGGKAVLETLAPGSDHEMLTIYTMEGKDLVLTHYCILGNQPHLKAEATNDPKQLVFKFAGGANVNPAKSNHMHEMTMTLVDDNHFRADWTRCEGGKTCETHGFDLIRKAK
jgi:hypothetical protein